MSGGDDVARPAGAPDDHGAAGSRRERGVGTPPGPQGPAPPGGGTPGDAGADLPDPSTFLSGESGTVAGRRLAVTRTAADWACDLAGLLALTGPRLDRLAARQPPRRVLVASIYRSGSLLPLALPRLRSSRHAVRLALGSTGPPDPALAADTALEDLDGGKFENLNRLLAEAGALGAAPPGETRVEGASGGGPGERDEASPEATGADDRAPGGRGAAAAPFDWLVVADDDVELAPRFLDRMVALCERLGLEIAQPAQTMRSHAAWRVTRRRPLSLARRTAYVEIGPVTLFSARAAAALTPFPELRYGWGLDNHWGAVARERGWRLGVVDALPVRHESQAVAASYAHAAATEEARRFLAGRPYVPTAEAQRTLATHRRLPS